MTQPRILVVDSNERRFQKLRDEINGIMLSHAIHRQDGESAVLWAGANDCDLCVLSYELPGIDGLETLARVRTRRPELPVLMIASSQDQQVAIAAFRAGVVDFVPATGAFTRIVAERAQTILNPGTDSRPAMSQVIEDLTLQDIPRDRLEPTYQNRLRAIGRQIDIYQYHSVIITELEGGFLMRAFRQRGRQPQVLEFSDRDFPRLISSAIEAEGTDAEKTISSGDLTPTGYEDMLRALGYQLDDLAAESIAITELQDMVVVSGRGNDEDAVVPGRLPFQKLLKREDIDYMLNEAFFRRGQPQLKVRKPEKRSGGIRGILRRLN